MQRRFIAVDLPEGAYSHLVSLQRNVPGVSWRVPPASLIITEFDADEAGMEAAVRQLGGLSAAPFDVSVDRLVFLMDREPCEILLKPSILRDLSMLIGALTGILGRAGLQPFVFEGGPALSIGGCAGTTRQDLVAYSAEVEPMSPLIIRVDRVLLGTTSNARGDNWNRRDRIDFEHPLRSG